MKKLKIVTFILLMVIIILNISGITVCAASDPISDPDFWKPSTSGDATLSEKIGTILGVIQVIGIVVSVIVLMVLGIKYMVGSAEEKAINKKAMIPYLVGAVMVFSVTTIPNFIYQLSNVLIPDHEHTWGGISYRISGDKHEAYKVCQNCGIEEVTVGEHIYRPHIQADGTAAQKCTLCGNVKQIAIQECTHNNLGITTYKINGNVHDIYRKCNDCQMEVLTGSAEHIYRPYSLEDGTLAQRCSLCYNIKVSVNDGCSHDELGSVISYKDILNDDYHAICKNCVDCGSAIQTSTEAHTYTNDEIIYESMGGYHVGYETCTKCGGKGAEVTSGNCHDTFEYITAEGIYKCTVCGYSI